MMYHNDEHTRLSTTLMLSSSSLLCYPYPLHKATFLISLSGQNANLSLICHTYRMAVIEAGALRSHHLLILRHPKCMPVAELPYQQHRS